jgi:hypothetical protein
VCAEFMCRGIGRSVCKWGTVCVEDVQCWALVKSEMKLFLSGNSGYLLSSQATISLKQVEPVPSMSG